MILCFREYTDFQEVICDLLRFLIVVVSVQRLFLGSTSQIRGKLLILILFLCLKLLCVLVRRLCS